MLHIETCVLLSHKKPDSHINVKVEFGEGEGKVPLDKIAERAEAYKPKERVTYKMMKEYIEAKYGFKVHTAYIAEVKRSLGLPMYDAPNAVEELKQPRNFVELQKLGDYDGYYKDWSMKKYMQTMYEICDNMDDVWISNYEYVDDDPAFRAFFISFLFDIDEVKYYEEVYQYCHEFCKQLDVLIRRKLSGCYWDEKFEIDEMAFCKLYLTPFFRNMGFEQVIFNHGNKGPDA